MKKLVANGVIEESIIEQICCNSNKGKASKMSVESNWIEEEQETENLISLFCSLSEKQSPPNHSMMSLRRHPHFTETQLKITPPDPLSRRLGVHFCLCVMTHRQWTAPLCALLLGIYCFCLTHIYIYMHSAVFTRLFQYSSDTVAPHALNDAPKS